MLAAVAVYTMRRVVAVERIKGWIDSHPLLVRLWLIPPAIVVGVVLVETGSVDGIEPGLWGRGVVPALILYGLVGWVGSFVLMFFAWSGWLGLAIVVHSLRWVLRLPVRVVRWGRRIGGRGVAGHALVGCSVLLAALALVALGDFRVDGVTFWIDTFISVGIVTGFGGVIGAFALVIVVTGIRNLVARRLPEPPDHTPTLWVLLSLGFVAGAGTLWEWSGSDEMLLQASGAELAWVTGPVAPAVTYGYAALVFVLVTLTRTIRARAGLLPRPDPASLVWHGGGPVPSRPSETHWSPEVVIGWRGWDVSGGYLVGHHGQPWKQSTFVASCSVGHRKPEWHCNCGVYALKRPEVHGAVLGRVAMDGTVIEHENGYRAERARILELWVIDPDFADWARQTYPDVPVSSGLPALSDAG